MKVSKAPVRSGATASEIETAGKASLSSVIVPMPTELAIVIVGAATERSVTENCWFDSLVTTVSSSFKLTVIRPVVEPAGIAVQALVVPL